MIKTYKIHEFASLVPMSLVDEQASLNNDIKKNGLKEPIILWNGKIVDGRCRQIACIFADVEIRTKELDDELSEEEVKSLVKSLNTRRNLSTTQKIISACKQSQDPMVKLSIPDIAEAWAIGKGSLDNARYIAKIRPEFIDPLFNGKSVDIVDKHGKEVQSIRVTAIYAYLKRMEEGAKVDDRHAWNPDSFIKTQLGKEWYYDEIKQLDNIVHAQMLVAELANYKYVKQDVEDILSA